MSLTDAQRHRIGLGTLLGVGVVLLTVPLLDVTTTLLSPNSALSSAVENAFPTLLVAFILFVAWYLHRTERPPEDTLIVARWTLGGAAVGAVAVLGVVGIQTMTQHVLRPYLVAGNLLMVLASAGTVVGLSQIRTADRRRELSVERDRFSALYENSPACILELHTNSRIHVDDRNRTYDVTVDEPDADPFDVIEAADGEPAFDRATVSRHLDAGENYRSEVRIQSAGETRDFVTQTIPVGADRAFLVLTDITAQKERERLLERREEELEHEATERAEELAERTNQLEFLHSLLRHDVQNGMMVIRSRAEFLADNVGGDLEQYADTIVARAADISDQIDRMRTTLDTLTGEGRSTSRVDLSAVLRERATSLREAEPQATVDLDVDPGLAIMADEMIDDVFANVFRNAVAHNDKDEPQIEVDARAEDGTVRVEIADNGPGISEEHRDSVFRRGVTSASSDHESGSGFGLFFVDTMVSAYDGTVWIEDNDPEGARFVFEFPSADAT